MSRKVLAVFGFAILGLGMPTQAADTISDNLTNVIGGDVTINGSSWSAQAFTTTTAGHIINSVILNMTRDGSTTGTVELYIYNLDVNNKPANQIAFLGSKDINSLIPISQANITFGGLNFNLAQTTTYYLLLRGSNVQNGDARWSYTDDEAGTGFPSYCSRTITSGASWNTPSLDSPQVMNITAVPEPSTILLSTPGTIAIYMVSRRRHS